MKIVINRDYGGYSLSDMAILKYAELKGIVLVKDVEASSEWINAFFLPDGLYFDEFDIARNDVYLVQAVELLGEHAQGARSELKIVEIPDDVEWQVEYNDGLEWVAEKHRTWY
jgi:hypothetical protein